MPVEVFESQEQLDKYLRWWQDKLCLNDWIIKAKIVSEEGMMDKGTSGEIIMYFENKCAEIRILDVLPPCIQKRCDEQVLVHELLHCLYDWLDCDDSYEGAYLDAVEHQKMDQLSKTLIMVKYGLDLSYFMGD